MSGNFPETWKCAKVTPIIKKGEKENPRNYRLISILPVLSKLFENHVAIQIYTLFETYSLFHKYNPDLESTTHAKKNLPN